MKGKKKKRRKHTHTHTKVLRVSSVTLMFTKGRIVIDMDLQVFNTKIKAEDSILKYIWEAF